MKLPAWAARGAAYIVIVAASGGCASTPRGGELPRVERTTACPPEEEQALRRKWRIVGKGKSVTRVLLHVRGDGSVERAEIVRSSRQEAADALALCMAMALSRPPPDGQPTSVEVPFSLKLTEP